MEAVKCEIVRVVFNVEMRRCTDDYHPEKCYGERSHCYDSTGEDLTAPNCPVWGVACFIKVDDLRAVV